MGGDFSRTLLPCRNALLRLLLLAVVGQVMMAFPLSVESFGAVSYTFRPSTAHEQARLAV